MTNNITLKGIIDEDFVNYKVPSMTLMFPTCDFKCDLANDMPVCQNSSLILEEDIVVSIDSICDRYLKNPISEAIVAQGLEPLDSFEELCDFLSCLRYNWECNDVVVIYTGYRKEDLGWKLEALKEYPNIIIKFGEYYWGQKPHYDEVLGVNLASDNQYAEKIS